MATADDNTRPAPSSTASTIVTREVRGHHTLTIDGCASKRNPSHVFSTSRTFEAAGYRWRIRYHPCGSTTAWWWPFARPCISLYLELDAAHERTDHPVEARFSLLGRDGKAVARHTRVAEARVFDAAARRAGFDDFIRWTDLEQSGCLVADRFTVRCDVTVLKDWAEDGDAARVPPPDLHEHLYDLLWTRQGTDVKIYVGGDRFYAHRWLLAARSPIFEAEMAAAAKDEGAPAGGGDDCPRVEIKGVEPRVFRAMLRFLYTDSLPRVDEQDAVAMAQGLLAAAHRYKLERLKPMCEEMLRGRIDVDTVAGTLVVAEQHGCHALKTACVEFMTYPGNMKLVMATEGFVKIKANHPSLLMELVMKQLVV